jgi:high-affinity nickel-transport protein
LDSGLGRRPAPQPPREAAQVPPVLRIENRHRALSDGRRKTILLSTHRQETRTTGLSGEEKGKVALAFVVILAVTSIGFVASLVVGRGAEVLAGLGLVAYALGLRHAVDADHVAAIDNATRKLLQEGRRPLTVGTWFSLGHSTVVVALIVAFVVAARAIASSVPTLQSEGGLVGTLVSGGFLWLIGLANFAIVIGIYRAFKRVRRGELDEVGLDAAMERRGPMNRLANRLFRVVDRPRQMYPIGVLFGLGFDTATEVALIAISVGAGVSETVPVYYVLVLPLMFTAGMVMVDTADGVAMRMAYGWAFLNPLRKVYYNLTVTVVSVLVAWAIGSMELLQVISSELGLSGGIWKWLGGLDSTMGYWIVGLFVASWAVSMAYWRLAGMDRRPQGTVRVRV